MSNTTTAIAALTTVAQQNFQTLLSDPTYGPMYASNFINTWKPDTYIIPTVAIYRVGGLATNQGLATVKQWRQARIRVDVFQANYANADQCIEALRTYWITDFNYYIGDGTVNKGYLRQVGGIKNLILGEPRATTWEKAQVQFRRIMELQLEIGD